MLRTPTHIWSNQCENKFGQIWPKHQYSNSGPMQSVPIRPRTPAEGGVWRRRGPAAELNIGQFRLWPKSVFQLFRWMWCGSCVCGQKILENVRRGRCGAEGWVKAGGPAGSQGGGAQTQKTWGARTPLGPERVGACRVGATGWWRADFGEVEG